MRGENEGEKVLWKGSLTIKDLPEKRKRTNHTCQSFDKELSHMMWSELRWYGTVNEMKIKTRQRTHRLFRRTVGGPGTQTVPEPNHSPNAIQLNVSSTTSPLLSRFNLLRMLAFLDCHQWRFTLGSSPNCRKCRSSTRATTRAPAYFLQYKP